MMTRPNMRRRATTAVAILGLALSAALSAAPLSAAGAATLAYQRGPMCDGHRATIVAGADETFQGTTHRDVIVANPRSTGNARGGDDLICLRGRNLTHVSTTIAAGSGDDVVLTQDAGAVRGGMPTVLLGAGNDVYQGTHNLDQVVTGSGQDRVWTREARDHVVDGGPDTVAEQTLGVAHAARSVIHLGKEPDVVELAGQPVGGSIDGGGARDGATIPVVCRDVPVALDLPRHQFRVNHRTKMKVSRIESFAITMGPGALTVRGSDAPVKGLILDRSEKCAQPASRHVDLAMGGGHDNVSTSFALRGRVDGGPGFDGLQGRFAATNSLDIDFSGPVSEDGTTRLRLHSVDRLGLDELTGNPDVTVTGTARPERILLVPGFTDQAASVTLRGGAGNDELVSNGAATMFGGPGNDFLQVVGNLPGRLEGQSGDDVLTGGGGDDVLIGGRGHDTADGQDGTDRCGAEVETNCEPTP